MLIHSVSSSIPDDTRKEDTLKEVVLKFRQLELNWTNGEERGGT